MSLSESWEAVTGYSMLLVQEKERIRGDWRRSHSHLRMTSGGTGRLIIVVIRSTRYGYYVRTQNYWYRPAPSRHSSTLCRNNSWRMDSLLLKNRGRRVHLKSCSDFELVPTCSWWLEQNRIVGSIPSLNIRRCSCVRNKWRDFTNLVVPISQQIAKETSPQ
jgi:hypothetical protein